MDTKVLIQTRYWTEDIPVHCTDTRQSADYRGLSAADAQMTKSLQRSHTILLSILSSFKWMNESCIVLFYGSQHGGGAQSCSDNRFGQTFDILLFAERTCE